MSQQGPPPAYSQGPPQGYPQGQPAPGPYPPQPYQQPYAPPQQQAQQQQQSTTTVIMAQPQQQVLVGGGCICGGMPSDSFTVCGILLAICFFPLGILCCFLLMEKRCDRCGRVF